MSDNEVTTKTIVENLDGQNWVLQAARKLRYGRFTIVVEFNDGIITLYRVAIETTQKPAPTAQVGGER